MELGNMIFGNSRGKYPIVEREQWDDVFWNEFHDVLDGYGYYTKEDSHQTERGGYENEVFKVEPYYWGDDEEEMEKPNFVYKPLNIEMSWYKYPWRDAYMNHMMTVEDAKRIFAECRKSMR